VYCPRSGGFQTALPCQDSGLTLLEEFGPEDAFAFHEDGYDRGKNPNVLKRIAIHDEQRRFLALFNCADAGICPQ
jgi:hypothetical protein